MSVTIPVAALEAERLKLESLGYKTFSEDFLREPRFTVYSMDDTVHFKVYQNTTVEVDICCYEAVTVDLSGLRDLIDTVLKMQAERVNQS